ARAEEIMLLVQREVKRSGYDGLLAAGLVLSGGSAQLAGLKELAERVLHVPVRIGGPHDLQGLTDVLESPAHATGVGLLLWAMHETEAAEALPKPRRQPSVFWNRVSGWFRAFLPG
ncbi:cell division FtsA domain-containing protein, partial [Chloroflexota bacterium]